MENGNRKEKEKKTTQKEYYKNTTENIKRLVYGHCTEYKV